jgi:hypothetical protein
LTSSLLCIKEGNGQQLMFFYVFLFMPWLEHVLTWFNALLGVHREIKYQAFYAFCIVSLNIMGSWKGNFQVSVRKGSILALLGILRFCFRWVGCPCAVMHTGSLQWIIGEGDILVCLDSIRMSLVP